MTLLIRILLILGACSFIVAWHGYNYSYTRLEDRSDCPSFEDATRPYKPDFIEKLSLWPNLMSIYDYEYGETLYGSQEGLEMIWKNQNPEDCSKAQFLISGGWPYGFGSRIHMEGAVLGMAMHLGRVYLPHPDGDNFFFETQTEFCRNKQRYEPGMNCFYQSYSKCTIKDATASVGGDVNKLRTYYMGDFRAAFEDETGLANMVGMLQEMRGVNLIMTYGGGPYNLQNYIPHQMRPLIDCSPMRQGADYYWWRAVSATFIARPNKETLAVLARYSNLPVQDFNDVISMFVRHGDKGIEMKLVDFPEYARVAQLMWDRGLLPMSGKYLAHRAAAAAGQDDTARKRRRLQKGRHEHRRSLTGRSAGHVTRRMADPTPTDGTGRDASGIDDRHNSQFFERRNVSDWANRGLDPGSDNIYNAPVPRAAKSTSALPSIPYNGTLFLTTEDPQVIAEANSWGAANHWTVVYTNLFDRATVTAMKTWAEQTKKGSVVVHDPLEYISMLVNLYYSLRSEGYVCTLKSNSCRIIDEMRATVGGKANRFYADISIESCPHPPCLDSDDEILTFGE